MIVKRIDRTRKEDINIPNQPFRLFGRILPSYQNGKWDYEIERYQEGAVTEMCFPDEHYDFDKLAQNSVFIGAYDKDKCIGLAILQQASFKYMYLYDLKVNTEYRGQGVASQLIENAKKIALESGYRGVYTQGQDNNLAACLFYLKSGFVIGGFDTHIYKGTSQEGKSDVLFYWDAENSFIS